MGDVLDCVPVVRWRIPRKSSEIAPSARRPCGTVCTIVRTSGVLTSAKFVDNNGKRGLGKTTVQPCEARRRRFQNACLPIKPNFGNFVNTIL